MASTFSIAFYNRNFTVRLPVSTPVKVMRYSHHMIGGPDKAYLSAPADADKWELINLLRCRIEIYGGDGRLNWWGYVNRVTIPHGEQRIGAGLDNMFNSITFSYGSGTTGGVTEAAVNTISTGTYGVKEKKLFDSNATLAQALQARNIYLAQHALPSTEIEFSGGENTVQIECYGWYKSLDWQYYSNIGTNEWETTTIIQDILAAKAQLIAGSVIENTSGINSNENRDGQRTSMDYINQLLSAGTANVRPLLATVDRDRNLHVYERPALSGVAYLLATDGSLITPLGRIVEPEHCICAAWVQIKDVPSQHTGNSSVQPFFIETAEYNAETDKTTYRPAGAYEQTRLAQYIKDVSHPGGETDFPPPVTTAVYAVDSFAYYALHNGVISSYSNTGVIYDVQDYSDSDSVFMTMTVSQDGLYLVGANIWDKSGDATTPITRRCVWCLIYGVTETNLGGSSPYVYGTYNPDAAEAAASAVGFSLLNGGDTLTFLGMGNYTDTTSTVPDQFHWFVMKIA